MHIYLTQFALNVRLADSELVRDYIWRRRRNAVFQRAKISSHSVKKRVEGTVILVASTPRPISHQPKLMHLAEARLFTKFLASASLLMSFLPTWSVRRYVVPV